MNRDFDIKSLGIALLINALAIFLLCVLGISMPEQKGESGVPVMMGNVQDPFVDYDFTTVEAMSVPPQPMSVPLDGDEFEPVLTQNLEETVAIEDGSRDARTQQETSQSSEEELRAQAIDSQLANLFAKSSVMQVSSEQPEAKVEEQVPGSTAGNASQGKLSGQGAYGTWDLGGRDMEGSLPRPVYNVQEEGCVVVTVVVNPDGNVISTDINKRTTTTSIELRNAARKAAAMTKFSRSSRPENQSGTITYYFRLK